MAGTGCRRRVAVNLLAAQDRWTGIGQYVRSSAAGLAGIESDWELYLLCASEAVRMGGGPGLRYLTVDGPGPLWEQLELPALLAEHRIAVYHNPALGLPLVRTCALVSTVHDCIPRLFPALVSPWLRDYFAQWAEVWLGQADQLICDSQHTAHDLRHLFGVDPGRLTVIYQDVSPSFRPWEDPEAAAPVKARYGLERPFVLCVGRVELRKNVPRLLRAFGRLQEQEGRRWQLVLAGPQDPEVYDPEGELPRPGQRGEVVVTGLVSEEDLVALYNAAELMCFPSLYEGFGRPVLEAMRCGTPVVTARVSSLPEVGGEAALYVNPYDVEELTATLRHALADNQLRERLRERGFAQAAKFSATQAAEQMLQVYARAAAAADY